MSPSMILLCISGYFSFLLAIAWVTGKRAGEAGYLLGNRASPWYAVAFGMIGDSLSGVTYISVPGAVNTAHFSYFQLVLGYFFGYLVIIRVLLPLYYRMQLTSIYSYLLGRFGPWAERTGSFFFILSRTLGAAARLYLAAGVLQLFVFAPLNIPFPVSVALILLLMLIYTYKGGIKTLVWTDTFQSAFLLIGVVLSILAIGSAMDFSVGQLFSSVKNDPHSQVFFWDWAPKSFFPKQFIGGMFIAIAMTGLDQNMMQKNLSMKTLGEAQKNIFWFSLVLIIVNLFFLALGVLLYQYAGAIGFELPLKLDGSPDTDKLFPLLALNHLGIFAGLAFILGLTAATFSSADSVLTTLTTSFYLDILHADRRSDWGERKRAQIRTMIHGSFAVLLLFVILILNELNNAAVIDTVLKIANYTYGPLLGLFFFGLWTRKNPRDHWIPLVCLAAPLVCFILDTNAKTWLGGYQFGHELLLLNGVLTWLGLWLLALGQPAGVPAQETPAP